MRLLRYLAMGLLSASTAVAGVSLAQEPVPETDESAPAEAAEGPEGGADLEAYWSRRLTNAAQRIESARQRLEEANAEYSRARHDRNPRGASLAEIEMRRAAAERELAEAKAALPRLVEQARRAGVAPGVLRDYWDMEAEEAEETG